MTENILARAAASNEKKRENIVWAAWVKLEDGIVLEPRLQN